MRSAVRSTSNQAVFINTGRRFLSKAACVIEQFHGDSGRHQELDPGQQRCLCIIAGSLSFRPASLVAHQAGLARREAGQRGLRIDRRIRRQMAGAGREGAAGHAGRRRHRRPDKAAGRRGAPEDRRSGQERPVAGVERRALASATGPDPESIDHGPTRGWPARPPTSRRCCKKQVPPLPLHRFRAGPIWAASTRAGRAGSSRMWQARGRSGMANCARSAMRSSSARRVRRRAARSRVRSVRCRKEAHCRSSRSTRASIFSPAAGQSGRASPPCSDGCGCEQAPFLAHLFQGRGKGLGWRSIARESTIAAPLRHPSPFL